MEQEKAIAISGKVSLAKTISEDDLDAKTTSEDDFDAKTTSEDDFDIETKIFVSGIREGINILKNEDDYKSIKIVLKYMMHSIEKHIGKQSLVYKRINYIISQLIDTKHLYFSTLNNDERTIISSFINEISDYINDKSEYKSECDNNNSNNSSSKYNLTLMQKTVTHTIKSLKNNTDFNSVKYLLNDLLNKLNIYEQFELNFLIQFLIPKIQYANNSFLSSKHQYHFTINQSEERILQILLTELETFATTKKIIIKTNNIKETPSKITSNNSETNSKINSKTKSETILSNTQQNKTNNLKSFLSITGGAILGALLEYLIKMLFGI